MELNLFLSRRLLTAAAALLAVFHLAAWWEARPALHSDPGWGLLAMQNRQSGGGWNSIRMADPEDLRRDRENPVTWWAPGQHVVPGAWMALAGGSVSSAVKAASLGCYAAAFAGWWLLIGRLSGRPRLAAVSALLIMSSRYATLSFFSYDGGETLLLAWFPWFWLGMEKLRASKSGAVLFLGSAVLVFAGMMMKYTFILACVGVLAFPAWMAGTRRAFARAALEAAGAAAALGLCFALLLSRGGTPAGGGGLVADASGLLYPWAAPLFAMTDLESLLHRIFLYPGSARLTEQALVRWEWLGLPILPALFWTAREPAGDPGWLRMRRTALLFCVLFAVALTVLYTTGARVSFEARHFRIPGILLLPFFAGWLWRLGGRPAARWAAVALGALFLAVPAVYGIASVADKAFRRPEGFVSPRTGLAQPFFDAPSHETLRRWLTEEDPARRDAVVYFTSPDQALEFPEARRLVVHADFVDRADLAGMRFRGRVPVLLVLPGHFDANGKTTAIQEGFVDVAGWREVANPGGLLRFYLGVPRP